MKQIILFSFIAALITSCTKEVTKIVPMNNQVTTSNNQTSDNTDSQAAEGTINGGGGKGIRCINNGVTTVELLDLYEARILYGLQSNYNPQNETEAMILYADLLTKHFWNPSTIPMTEYKQYFLSQMKNTVLKNIRYISSDKKLKLTNDSFEPLIEKNCEMVQVAHYYDESILLIDQSLWNQMSWLNKIALLTHETVYFMDRMYGSTNSMASRKLVGQLFSSEGSRPKSDGIPTDENKFADCLIVNENRVSVGFLYVYENIKAPIYNDPSDKINGLEFVFNYFLNSTQLFRTSTFLINKTLNELFQKDFQGYGETYLETDSYTAATQLLSISLTGDGKGKLSVKDTRTGMVTSNLSLSCQKRNP